METKTEPMTPERLATIRQTCQVMRISPAGLDQEVFALCEEIVRLRDWLQHIHDEKNHSGYTLRHYAWRALEGQTVEEWQ